MILTVLSIAAAIILLLVAFIALLGFIDAALDHDPLTKMITFVVILLTSWGLNYLLPILFEEMSKSTPA